MGLAGSQVDVVLCLKLGNFFSLGWHESLSEFKYIFLALGFEVFGGDAEVVEAVAVEQFAVFI